MLIGATGLAGMVTSYTATPPSSSTQQAKHLLPTMVLTGTLPKHTINPIWAVVTTSTELTIYQAASTCMLTMCCSSLQVVAQRPKLQQAAPISSWVPLPLQMLLTWPLVSILHGSSCPQESFSDQSPLLHLPPNSLLLRSQLQASATATWTCRLGHTSTE